MASQGSIYSTQGWVSRAFGRKERERSSIDLTRVRDLFRSGKPVVSAAWPACTVCKYAACPLWLWRAALEPTFDGPTAASDAVAAFTRLPAAAAAWAAPRTDISAAVAAVRACRTWPARSAARAAVPRPSELNPVAAALILCRHDRIGRTDKSDEHGTVTAARLRAFQRQSRSRYAWLRVDLQASPQQDYAGPAKGKRSARAYHQYDTPQAPSPQQQPQYGYQQQGQQQAYANAPPPGPQPGQYHQQQQQQQYLHQEQPQGQVFQQPGIPQPPHNPGTKLPGLRNRIDPDQIPSVVDVQEQDQQVYDAEAYLTCGRGTVPLSTTQFTAIDQGSSTPRFIRLTTYNLPATDDLASLSHLPMGIVLQPFAEPLTENGEEPVYTVDFSQTAPPRCKRCRGYINPWCMFIEAGQKFVCNLCGSATEGTLSHTCALLALA